jgi:hypothetical protein
MKPFLMETLLRLAVEAAECRGTPRCGGLSDADRESSADPDVMLSLSRKDE